MPVETPARPELIHRDFYEILGVSHGASEEAIRSAYRKLVLKWHPDRHRTNKEEKARRFMEAHEAFLVLTDADSRAVYDGLYHPQDSPLLQANVDLPPPPEPFSQAADSQFDTAQTQGQTDLGTAKQQDIPEPEPQPDTEPQTPADLPGDDDGDDGGDANDDDDDDDAATPTNPTPTPGGGEPPDAPKTPPADEPDKPEPAADAGENNAVASPIPVEANAGVGVAASDDKGADDSATPPPPPPPPADPAPEPTNDGVSPQKAADDVDLTACVPAGLAVDSKEKEKEEDKDLVDDDDDPLTDLSSLTDGKDDELKSPLDPITPITMTLAAGFDTNRLANALLGGDGRGADVKVDGDGEAAGDKSPADDVEKDPSTPDTVKPATAAAAAAAGTTEVANGETSAPADSPTKSAEDDAADADADADAVTVPTSPVGAAVDNAAAQSPTKVDNDATTGGDDGAGSPTKDKNDAAAATGEGEGKGEGGDEGEAVPKTTEGGETDEVKPELTPTTPNPPADESGATPKPTADAAVNPDATVDAANAPEPSATNDTPETPVTKDAPSPTATNDAPSPPVTKDAPSPTATNDTPEPSADAPNAAGSAEQPNVAPSPTTTTKADEGEGGARTDDANVDHAQAEPEDKKASPTTENAETKVETAEGDGAAPASPEEKKVDDTPPAADDEEPATTNTEDKVDSPSKTTPVDVQPSAEPEVPPTDETKDSPVETSDVTGDNADEPADAKTPTVDDKDKTPVDETGHAAKSPTDLPNTEPEDKPGDKDHTEPSGAAATPATDVAADTAVADGQQDAGTTGPADPEPDTAKVDVETPTPGDQQKVEPAEPAADNAAPETPGADGQSKPEPTDLATATPQTPVPDEQDKTDAAGPASTAGDTTNDISTSLTKDTDDKDGQDETQATTPTQAHAPSPSPSKDDIPASEPTPTTDLPSTNFTSDDAGSSPQAGASEPEPPATPATPVGPKRVTVRAPSPEANESALPSGAATPRPNSSLFPSGIPESVLATPKESGANTPWGRSIPSTPLSDTSNWNARPQSSRARSAHNMLRDRRQEAESMKGDTTSGARTPVTVTGRGWPSTGDVTPVPRGILKDRAKSAQSPPPIPPISATSGAVPAEWVYPLHVPLETLYTGARLRYRVTRYLLSGETQESYVDIEVKPGWRKGTKIRFAGLGNERAPPLPPQDVLFVVDEVPHARFRREGSNLFTTCDINLLDALADTQHVIQGLDGNNIVVDVGSELAGGIIRPGDISRVVGMGMPVRRNSQVAGSGDLIIKWNIVFPDQLSTKQRRMLRAARDEEANDTTAPATPM